VRSKKETASAQAQRQSANPYLPPSAGFTRFPSPAVFGTQKVLYVMFYQMSTQNFNFLDFLFHGAAREQHPL
jgi:hypothetical protein